MTQTTPALSFCGIAFILIFFVFPALAQSDSSLYSQFTKNEKNIWWDCFNRVYNVRRCTDDMSYCVNGFLDPQPYGDHDNEKVRDSTYCDEYVMLGKPPGWTLHLDDRWPMIVKDRPYPHISTLNLGD